jgi:hypothetical protein
VLYALQPPAHFQKKEERKKERKKERKEGRQADRQIMEVVGGVASLAIQVRPNYLLGPQNCTMTVSERLHSADVQ